MKAGSDGRIGSVVLAALLSGGSTSTSFFVQTMPVLQWFAVLVGICAGLMSILLGFRKYRAVSNRSIGDQDPTD